jgi:inosine/xanthosine triphosphate pyrophosphatase family protein
LRIALPGVSERISFLRDAQMKLSENKDSIFYRFEQTDGTWYEFAYVKAQKRFRASRCNAFAKDSGWEEMDASSMPEAQQGAFAWVNRN